MDRFGHEQARDADPRHGGGRGLPRFAEASLAYLRSRTTDHWIMFVAGVVLGTLLG